MCEKERSGRGRGEREGRRREGRVGRICDPDGEKNRGGGETSVKLHLRIYHHVGDPDITF